MRKLIIILLFIPITSLAEEWTKADSQRETVYLVLHAADWLQTRNIARDPVRWHEYNPIIGKHPTIGRVNNYFALSTIAHISIVDALPKEYRKAFQYFTIGFKGKLVYHNFHVGISAQF